jgi:2-polyprenyl-6-methoxyphenol hydroxylase-like FAD-dependent oxidoreductase
MRIAILGAGPAGLYAGYLLKHRHPELEIAVYEQNPPDATFGFGVVFSDRALEFLHADDPDTYAAITPHLEAWSDITVAHRGERWTLDNIGFAAIGRLQLLQLLQERARSVGVVPEFRRTIGSMAELGTADLIIAADGVNSLIRQALSAQFGTTLSHFSNRFVWYGVGKTFPTLSQTFRRTEHGNFNAHHYRYSPQMSTFLVEVDEKTFFGAGLDRMSEAESKRLCEQVFADELGGVPLISNRSIWRQFPMVANERWHHGNVVLVGDALRTAHFSIGSGTRLAMEDVIALVKALDAHWGDMPAALSAYERQRRPIVEKLVNAANASARWYERFGEHMALEPVDFVMSYITRSGRVPHARLRQVSPGFMARYDRARPSAAER